MEKQEGMIYLILGVHWFADFVLQSDMMAKNKSKSFKWLAFHVAVYTLCMIVFGWKFALLNGLAHFLIDAVTSRVSGYMWRTGKVHNFFVVIGFDQLLHVLLLIYSAKYLGVIK